MILEYISPRKFRVRIARFSTAKKKVSKIIVATTGCFAAISAD
jgi:hypothetical protein